MYYSLLNTAAGASIDSDRHSPWRPRDWANLACGPREVSSGIPVLRWPAFHLTTRTPDKNRYFYPCRPSSWLFVAYVHLYIHLQLVQTVEFNLYAHGWFQAVRE